MRRADLHRLPLASLVLAVSCAAVVGFGWLISSPPGSSPDEDFHLASAWCAAGIRPYFCEHSQDGPAYLVLPKRVIAQTCFAHNPLQSGACQDAVKPTDRQTLWRDFANQTGAYPNVYYVIMGSLVSKDTWLSVYAIRVANFLAVLLLFSAAFYLAPYGLRQALAGSWLVALVPLGLSLLASVNPSGWAIAGVGLFWAGLMSLPYQTSRRRLVALSIVMAVAVVFACVRRDSTIFLGIVCVAALLQSEPLRLMLWRRRWIVAVGTVAIAVASVSMLIGLRAEVVKVLTPGRNEGTPVVGIPSLDLLAANFMRSLEFVVGSLGAWGLGQIDTPLPSNVWILASGAFWAAIAIGLGRAYGGKVAAAVLIASTIVVVPLITLQSGSLQVGQGVQPRYFLPLVLVLAGVALVPRDLNSGIRLTSPQRWLIAGAAAGAQSIAFYTYVRRYISGSDITAWNLDDGVEWWWTWMPSPMFTWLIVTVAFAVLAGLAVRMYRSSAIGMRP